MACLDEDDETWKRVLLELNILGSLGFTNIDSRFWARVCGYVNKRWRCVTVKALAKTRARVA